MNRQSASRKTFGTVMVVVALLLSACGSDDGDSTPTPTSGANQAVPTLPASDATAAAEISEGNLTVVTPNVPARQGDQATDLTGEATPDAAGTTVELPLAEGTPEGTATSALNIGDTGTPTAQGSLDADGPATADVASQPLPADPAVASPAATIAGQTFDIAGDGTGGSGQPGERSSNIEEPSSSPVASPVAAVEVEGCEITTIPPFTGTSSAYVTNADVFFRQGPGAECTPVYETPLAEGQSVEVIGGPVSQAADGTIWIQVAVDGVPGWVSFDFVEPAG